MFSFSVFWFKEGLISKMVG